MKVITIKTEQDKIECLDACSGDGLSLVFFYDEDPNDFLGNPHPVRRIGENKYLVSPPYRHEELSPWLRFGNWQAVYPETADYDYSFNTFKSSEQEIEQFMNAHAIELMIDSFYDDTEWKAAWNI